jgi:hypothetical protein
MPRFHFHLEDGTTFRDEDGTVLPDLEAARINAVKLLGHVMADNAPQFLSTKVWTMRVTDGSDLMLFSVNVATVDASAGTADASAATSSPQEPGMSAPRVDGAGHDG